MSSDQGKDKKEINCFLNWIYGTAWAWHIILNVALNVVEKTK